MAGLKTRKSDRSNAVQRAFSRVAVLTAALAISCSNTEPKQAAKEQPGSGAEKPVKMRCYDNENQKLRLSIEGRSESELTSEQLKVKGDALASFCTYDGHLFWVTKNNVSIRKITYDGRKFNVTRVLDVQHTKPDEYHVQGVQVVDADVWQNPASKWEKISIATITSNGLFQSLRLSAEDIANNYPDRIIFDLKRDIKKYQWQKSGVETASIKVIGRTRFVVIPVGEPDKCNTTNSYNIVFSGDPEKRFMDMDPEIVTITHGKDYPELYNIVGISKPIRYDLALGGWVVDLIGETEKGKRFDFFPTVTPSD